MGDDQFLTTEEVLSYLQINLRTIYRLLKARQIPAVRVGRQWRFRRADLDAWLAARAANGRDPLTRPRILVVDDDPAVLELLGKSLQLWTTKWICAAMGRRASNASRRSSTTS